MSIRFLLLLVAQQLQSQPFCYTQREKHRERDREREWGRGGGGVLCKWGKVALWKKQMKQRPRNGRMKRSDSFSARSAVQTTTWHKAKEEERSGGEGGGVEERQPLDFNVSSTEHDHLRTTGVGWGGVGWGVGGIHKKRPITTRRDARKKNNKWVA